ncbi:YdcF family protein [Paucilactobacillus kaifaensis]|uniref:YdcF family protein n=1 Tax=Paucilactobacillus kaifaensis TaxID=2559921 RepID=UPI0010F6EF32|nr:YdcF family protein [Paucilactobacillus kaifaensis]
MSISLFALLLIGILFFIITITQSSLQSTGYLATGLLCLVTLIGLSNFRSLAVTVIVFIILTLIIWLSRGLSELIKQTPELFLRLSLNFKLTLIGATLWLVICFLIILLIMFRPTLPIGLQLFGTMPIYFILTLLAYYLNSWLLLRTSNFASQNQVLLILGAGLTNGTQPGTELKRRLDKAIELNQINNNNPLIIVAGGQGPDERQTEAAAMKQYLVTHAVNTEQIVMENQSRNTWENLVNSQQLINQKFNYQPTVTVISSHYHLLRVCLYARKLNFAIQPVGVKSASQLYVSSSIREWISILLMHPYQHCTFAIIFTLIVNSVQIINS